MMIIGVTGKKQSGKDTIFKVIKELYPEAERRAFADKLKQSIAALFNVSPEWIESYKENPSYYFTYGEEYDEWGEDYYVTGFYRVEEIEFTLRELLQRYGTEAHRDIFGQDFWLEQCLPRPKNESDILTYEQSLIVVTDVRFDNEARWIRDLGGVVWHVERRQAPENDAHVSESGIDPGLIDLHIRNDYATIDELRERVADELERSLEINRLTKGREW